MNLTRMLRASEFTSAHGSPYHMLPGRDRRLRAARSGDALDCFGKQGKNRASDIGSLNDKSIAKTVSIFFGINRYKNYLFKSVKMCRYVSVCMCGEGVPDTRFRLPYT